MTVVEIRGDKFFIDGKPTLQGRTFEGVSIEGLLTNSRMVQGIFDDLNPATRPNWDYPDGPWDPDRNTDEFIAAMPQWRRRGLLGFTINLQGGCPFGYMRFEDGKLPRGMEPGHDMSRQPWDSGAFEPDGSLRGPFMARLARILDEADRLGMAPIVGLFYFGQDQRLADEAAVCRAVDNAVDWLCAGPWRNVLVEVANEVNIPHYTHDIIKAPRCHELIERVRTRSGGRLLAGTSMGGRAIPPGAIVAASDVVLLHGNGVSEPAFIGEMVETVRAMPEYRGQPIVFNEDDHFGFDRPVNNLTEAVRHRAGWGYFDYRMKGEGYDEGYQSVPVNWGISSERKRGFFGLLARVTGPGRR